MIKKNTDIQIDNDLNFNITTLHTSNNIPLLQENYFKKMQANNGMSKDRTIKELAEIPLLAVLKATEQGYNLLNISDLMKFLAENPEFATSNYYVTPGSNSHKIIIK